MGAAGGFGQDAKTMLWLCMVDNAATQEIGYVAKNRDFFEKIPNPIVEAQKLSI